MMEWIARFTTLVAPEKARVQSGWGSGTETWVPAFAGMTRIRSTGAHWAVD